MNSNCENMSQTNLDSEQFRSANKIVKNQRRENKSNRMEGKTYKGMYVQRKSYE